MKAHRAGDRLCSAWVRWYTRRLPGLIAGQRRAEIASDLWEHRQDAMEHGRTPARHELDVIGRVLSGIPADLSWRREVLRSPTRPAPGVPTTSSLTASRTGVLLTVLAILGLGVAATMAPLLVAAAFFEGIEILGVVWLLATTAFALSLLIGLIRRDRGTEPSTPFLVIGSPAPALAWFWLPPMLLLTVAIAVTAVLSRPRRALPARPTT
jgi:hypothetical protein